LGEEHSGWFDRGRFWHLYSRYLGCRRRRGRGGPCFSSWCRNNGSDLRLYYWR
jgi:hypothetical protein